jgi:SH3 domain-containing YSC84-like protein 1
MHKVDRPSRRIVLGSTGAAAILALAACAPASRESTATASGTPRSAQSQLLDDARATVESFRADPQNTFMPSALQQARAVVVFPQLMKGGFIFGVEGGNGVLMTRNAAGGFGQPVFVNMGAASLGLQAGIQSAETIMFVNSERALEKLLSDKVTLGADASVAVVNVGGGAAAGTAPSMTGDITAVSRTRGLYGGLTFEGSVIAPDASANRDFYGRNVTTQEISAMSPQSPNAAQGLRSALATR